MNNDNKKIITIGIGILIVVAVLFYAFNEYYDNNDTGSVSQNTNVNTAPTGAAGDLTTSGSVSVGSNIDTNTNMATGTAKYISGYPASWPSDVAKYPNGVVISAAPDNLKSKPKEAVVILMTTDAVQSVVNFYLNNLKVNGWKITQSGAGLANQITFRASKGARSFGGYAERIQDGKTKLTMGLNQGF